MFPYIITFLLSTLLLFFSDRVKVNQRNYIVILALILPAVLAAFRANNIGTDVEVYLNPIINAALETSSFDEYLNFEWFGEWRPVFVSEFEIGFTTLVYFIANSFGATWTKFILQVLIIFPIYIAIKKYNKYPAWLGMLVFYLMMYNSTLNMIRQSIAISFILLAIVYLLENKKKYFIVSFLIAVLFHKTAFILLVIVALYYWIRLKSLHHKTIIYSEFYKVFIVILLAVCGLFSINLIAKLLSLIGYDSYLNYLEGEFYFLPNQLAYHAPIFLLICYNWKKWNSYEYNARFFLVLFVLMLVCLQLRSINMYLGRVASFFLCFSVLIYPSLCYTSRSQTKRFLMISYLIIYLGIYWYQYYVINGIDATIPYLMLLEE